MENVIIRSNKAEIFTSEEFGQVKTILNEDGSVSINAEDAAIGLGWYEEKAGRKYIRWRTVNNFLKSFGFNEEVQKDDYIPESLFYLLAMKASNDTAQDFQRWIAIEVIPEIRATGRYIGSKRNGFNYGQNRSGGAGFPRSAGNMNNDFESSNVQTPISRELQAILCIDKRTTDVSNRVTKIENTATIDYGQQEEIRQLVNKKVIEVLGGKDTPAYKELSKKVYCSIWNDYKRKLNVSTYRNTSIVKYDYARSVLESWVPSREISLMITGANVE